MRSTFTGLNTMVRGIMNNQISLDTTGHNISNASTEGYSRQTVNPAATQAQSQDGMHGMVMVGTGVDALSIQRARNIYADIQYRNENPIHQYYKTLAVNYDKLETIFDDSKDLGIEAAMGEFYQAWVDLSTTASTAASRTQIIEQGRKLVNVMKSAVEELQKQINSEYNDTRDEVDGVNQILEHIVSLNKQIIAQEATGASCNDLRDQRDMLTDELSNYMNIGVTENEKGAYLINSGGITLVNGVDRTHLEMTDGISSVTYGVDYGVVDYNIKIAESNMVFLPNTGIFRARYDAIEECKSFIDKMADIANFLLSTFNDQHKQGYDLDGNKKYLRPNGSTESDDMVNTDIRVEYVVAEGEDDAGAYRPTANVKYDASDGKYYFYKTTTTTAYKTADGADLPANVTVQQRADGTYYYLNGNEEVDVTASTSTVETKDVEVIKVDGEKYLKKKPLSDGSDYGTYEDIITVAPDTYNFFGDGKIDYQYRYDTDLKINYLYKNDSNEKDESKKFLTGVQIIDELTINSVFDRERGYRYVAAATSKTSKEILNADGNPVTDENGRPEIEWVDMAWDDRTGDGTNAVYLSELFNLQFDTITGAGKANAVLLQEKCQRRNKAGELIDDDANLVRSDDTTKYYATAITRLSINSFYQRSMSKLGLDSQSVDKNYDAAEVVLTQISNWRDATAGVDWNEELTNMIKFQKGYASCSRCLTTMDEMLDRLINNTGVVGR